MHGRLTRGIPHRLDSRHRRGNEGKLRHHRTGGRGTRRLPTKDAPVAARGENRRGRENRATVVHAPAYSGPPTEGQDIYNQYGTARSELGPT